MLKLSASLNDWESDSFAETFKAELKQLPSGSLPLDGGVTQGGYVDDGDIGVTLLRLTENAHNVQVHFGIFFTEIVVCCGCGDDPMRQHAYCEMQVEIDKSTAEAVFRVVQYQA